MNGSERFQDRHEHAYGHGDERAQLDRQAQLHGVQTVFQAVDFDLQIVLGDQAIHSAEIAFAKNIYSESRTFTYFCGVCWSKIMESNNAKI